MNKEAEEDRKRNSLLLLAEILADGKVWLVKVRNISAGGLMAEPCDDLAPGSIVQIELRHIGQIGGRIAWVDHPRFGITFDRAIDHRAVRDTIRPTAKANRTEDVFPLRRI